MASMQVPPTYFPIIILRITIYNVGGDNDNDDRDTDKIGIFDGTITISAASVN